MKGAMRSVRRMRQNRAIGGRRNESSNMKDMGVGAV